MAVPAGSGSDFPIRRVIRTQLGPVVGDTRDLGANRGSQRFDDLSEIYENESDIYYKPQSSPKARRMEVEDSEFSVAFVEVDIPTSSTNYSRPRTVAAGYDPERETMTVVFRDGTFYNYYQVTRGEWQAFKSSISKGNPWLNRANKNQGADGLFIGKPRGIADVQSISPEVRELLYRVVRTQQLYKGPKLNRGRAPQSSANRRQSALKAAAARTRKGTPRKRPR